MYLSDNGVVSHPQFKSFSIGTLNIGRKSPSTEKNVFFRYRLNGLKQKSRLSDHTQTTLFICESRYATDGQPAIRGNFHHVGVRSPTPE